MPEAPFKIRVMAIGARRIGPRDWGLGFVKLTETQQAPDPVNLTEVLVFAKKVKTHMGGLPGSIYLVESDDAEGHKIYSHTAKFQEHWDSVEDRAAWEAKHYALIGEISGAIDDKVEEKHSALLDSLMVARQAYGRSVGANRAQMLAIMVSYITGGARQ
jgi:hypothetical protein